MYMYVYMYIYLYIHIHTIVQPQQQSTFWSMISYGIQIFWDLLSACLSGDVIITVCVITGCVIFSLCEGVCVLDNL